MALISPFVILRPDYTLAERMQRLLADSVGSHPLSPSELAVMCAVDRRAAQQRLGVAGPARELRALASVGEQERLGQTHCWQCCAAARTRRRRKNDKWLVKHMVEITANEASTFGDNQDSQARPALLASACIAPCPLPCPTDSLPVLEPFVTSSFWPVALLGPFVTCLHHGHLAPGLAPCCRACGCGEPIRRQERSECSASWGCGVRGVQNDQQRQQRARLGVISGGDEQENMRDRHKRQGAWL